MNPKLNAVLSDIRRQLQESVYSAQVINHVEPLDEEDQLDVFFAESARMVSRETGLDEEAALDHVFALAEAGEESGHLPPLPGTDATVEEIEEWLTAAGETGFTLQAVMNIETADK